MSNASRPSRQQILGLVIVILVILGIVYKTFTSQYAAAIFKGRFDFHKPPITGAMQPVDLSVYLKNSPELMAEGKQVFAANCVPCHGPQGYGNGPRSVGLNPPPRNFHGTFFRFGTSVLTLYHTVSNGSPGTSMPSFAALSPKQRMAVVHYVRHWIQPELLQANTPAQLAAISGAGANSGPTPLPKLQPVPNGPRIPIAMAMTGYLQMAQAQQAQQQPAATPAAVAPAVLQLGASLYQAQCQSCHGAQGQGGVPVRMVDSAPYLEVTAQSFQQPLMLASLSDVNGFTHLVTHGLPGRMMPGFGTLTKPEVAALQAYIETLAAPAGGAQ